MFVVENFFVALAKILEMGLTIYMWIIIGRAVISWVNPDPYNPIVTFLYRATEPVMAPVRRLIPMRGLGIDIAPVIVILIIYFLQTFLIKTMMQMAGYIR